MFDYYYLLSQAKGPKTLIFLPKEVYYYLKKQLVQMMLIIYYLYKICVHTCWEVCRPSTPCFSAFEVHKIVILIPFSCFGQLWLISVFLMNFWYFLWCVVHTLIHIWCKNKDMLTKTGYISPLTPKNSWKISTKLGGGWVVLQEKMW